MFFPLADVSINPLLLIGIGLVVGICSGFFGFGGGFLTTPALNIFGFPMPYAIGTDMTQMAGSGFLSTMRHRKFGHVDFRLAITMVIGTMAGVEVGKRLVLYLESLGNADVVIRWIYIAILGALGFYMLNEARRSIRREASSLQGKNEPQSDKPTDLVKKIRSLKIPPMISFPVSGIPSMSIWVPIGIGFMTGVLGGLLGVGGGFIRMPTLVYLMGVPTVIAIGTDLFEVIISGAYGAFTYALADRVELLAAGLVLVGASVGVQIGARATRYVHGSYIRFCFAITIMFAGMSVLLKQLAEILGMEPLNSISGYVLLTVAGGMSLLIVVLFTRAWSGARRMRKETHAQYLPANGKNYG